MLLRRLITAGAAAAVALGLSALYAQPAAAVSPVAATGYVRLAHLSPDTPDVDVYLNSVSNAVPQKIFPAVGYGVVSQYMKLPTGTYAVAMRAARAPASAAPVLSTEVTVAAGKAYTVAGVGKHADLGLRVIVDDLSLPSQGKSKVRIIQASVRAPVLDVTGVTGASIATGVAFATTTDYREVNPGKWTLNVGPAGGSPSTLECTMAAGNVYSLIVLDNTSGTGLKLALRVDAERNGVVPTGGMDTGGGGTSRSGLAPALGIGAVLALISIALVALVVRWRVRRP